MNEAIEEHEYRIGGQTFYVAGETLREFAQTKGVAETNLAILGAKCRGELVAAARAVSAGRHGERIEIRQI
jgi:hypothetical protein